MAQPSSFTARCVNKNIIPAGSQIPTAPGAPTTEDFVMVSLQVVDDGTGAFSGNMGICFALADDVYQVGEYYDVAFSKGSAPAKKTAGKKA